MKINSIYWYLIMYSEHIMCENKQYILVFNNVQGACNEV